MSAKLDRLAGEVGAAVVIFDEDRDDRYQYSPPGWASTRMNRTWRFIQRFRSSIWWARGSAAPNTAAF